MPSSLLKWLLITALLHAQVHGRHVPKISVFSKTQKFLDKRVMLSAPKGLVTENESFLYAVCDSQKRVFVRERCNVTIETPAFANATYKETCILNFATDDPHHETLSNLHLHSFGDDRALISWLVRDQDLRTKLSKIRILRLSNCKYHDVSVPSEESRNIIAYENTFDVIVKNKTFCAVDNCKLTFDSEGKRTHGPTPYLSNLKFFTLTDIVPVQPHMPVKGSFVQLFTNDTGHRSILLVSPEGRGAELLSLKNPRQVRLSNAHGAFGVCWSSERTNVTCRQYDSKMDLKLSVVFEFLDEPGSEESARWLQPHNLQDGGLLLVTGASDYTGQRYAGFGIVRVNADGRKERPLIVEGLELECLSGKFFASVSENEEEDELCVHFTCQLDKYGEHGLASSLSLETRCLPRKYAAIPKRRASLVN